MWTLWVCSDSWVLFTFSADENCHVLSFSLQVGYFWPENWEVVILLYIFKFNTKLSLT